MALWKLEKNVIVVGKRIAGIRVVSHKDGTRPVVNRLAALRHEAFAARHRYTHFHFPQLSYSHFSSRDLAVLRIVSSSLGTSVGTIMDVGILVFVMVGLPAVLRPLTNPTKQSVTRSLFALWG